MTSRSVPHRAAFAPRCRQTPAVWSIAIVMTCSVTAHRSASAGPILSLGAVELHSFTSLGDVVTDFRSEVFEPGDFGRIGTLGQPRTWTRFPTSTSPVPQGFVSTEMSTGRVGGVGISGIQQIRDKNANALVTYTQSLTNVGDESGAVFITYTIPTLEASILAGASIDPGDELMASSARALLTLIKFAEDGSELPAEDVFDYSLSFERLGPGLFNTQAGLSNQLFEERGLGTSILDGDVVGLRYLQFTEERLMTTLRPGESVTFSYQLSAAVINAADIEEVGFQALVGDPFQTSGPELFRFRIGAAAVPEPASLACLATGLVTAVVLRLLRRYGPRRRPGQRATCSDELGPPESPCPRGE